MGTNERDRRMSRLRPDTLLPMVRAAMERGEGPPAVLAWVRANGHAARNDGWTTHDEVRARALAGRLATTLTPSGGNELRTLPLGETCSSERFVGA